MTRLTTLLLALAACALAAPHHNHLETEHLCPPGCYCPVLKNHEVRVTCKFEDKGEVPRVFPPNTVHLDLSHNERLVLNDQSFVNNNLSKLRTLDISNCGLKSIDPKILQPLKNLHKIYLGNNQLTKYSLGTLLRGLKDRTHMNLHVGGNKFDCPKMKGRYSQWVIHCAAGGTTIRSSFKKVTDVSTTTKVQTERTTTSSQTKEKMTSTTPEEVQSTTPTGTSERVRETTPMEVQSTTPTGTSERVRETTPMVGNADTKGGLDAKYTWMLCVFIAILVVILFGAATCVHCFKRNCGYNRINKIDNIHY